MKRSENLADLAKALAKAHLELKHAKKSKNNPHFKSDYADLADVLDACREVLARNGITFIHFPESEDGAVVTVTCLMIHDSGQWVESALVLKPSKADCQGVGSAITYGRRFTLAAMAGVATEDDDGMAAAAPAGPPAAQRSVPVNGSPKAPVETPSGDRAALVEAVLKWSGVQREDIPSVMNTLKRRLRIEGPLGAEHYKRVSKFVADMVSKGKSLEDVAADADAVEAENPGE